MEKLHESSINSIFLILAIGLIRKKINTKYEFIHYVLTLLFYIFIFLFVYILGMHF